MQLRVRSAWISLSLGVVFFAVFAWISYGWERSTGFTFAQRNVPSRVSTPEHLARTRSLAVGATIFAACFGASCLLLRDRN